MLRQTLQNPNKICGTCIHVRLTLGIVTSLDFKVKLKRILQHLTAQDQTMENISIDRNMFEVLAFLNWLSKQKFYCRKERSWTHLFDKGCFAWQQIEVSTPKIT